MEEWEKDGMEGAEGGQEGTDRGRERERERMEGGGQSCLFWSIQVSALFDEDEVKC